MKLAVGKMHLERRLAGIADHLDHLRAGLLRAQLPTIKDNISQWNVPNYTLAARLDAMKACDDPVTVAGEILCRLLDPVPRQGARPRLMEACAAHGVELKWFGDNEPRAFTSRYDS